MQEEIRSYEFLNVVHPMGFLNELPLEIKMDNQVWDHEGSTDNDESIARLEAEIADEKAMVNRLSSSDDLF